MGAAVPAEVRPHHVEVQMVASALHLIGRGRRKLTRRQATALAATAVLSSAIIVAALAGQPALATSLLGLVATILLVGLIQVRRRLDRMHDGIDRAERHLLAAVRRDSERVCERVVEEVHACVAHLEFAHRRVMAAVENERLAAWDRHRALAGAMERLPGDIGMDRWEQTREFEAVMQLFRNVAPRAPMPPSGGWALNPTGLLQLLFHIDRTRPKTVLELGSGTSTVWLGYAIEGHGGRLLSLDHDESYAARTRSLLSAHGLDGVAEVRVAPLQPVTIDDQVFRWYDVAAVADLGDIDLLVIDGPPGATGPQARYPALHVLEHRLAATATIILDDAERTDEREVVRRWTATVKGLTRERAIFDRQAILSYSRYGPED
jgi:predicted O-methyltransferase YrrM